MEPEEKQDAFDEYLDARNRENSELVERLKVIREKYTEELRSSSNLSGLLRLLTDAEKLDLAHLLLRNVEVEDFEDELVEFGEWVRGCLHQPVDGRVEREARERRELRDLKLAALMALSSFHPKLVAARDEIRALHERLKRSTS